MSEPEPTTHIQTRPKNANQHPGLMVKRRRRTQAEMKEARDQKNQEKDDLERLRQEKVRDLAALEEKIGKRDVQAIAGAHTVRPKPRPHPQVPVIIQVSISLLDGYDIC